MKDESDHELQEALPAMEKAWSANGKKPWISDRKKTAKNPEICDFHLWISFCGFPVRPKLLWIAWTRPNCTKSPPTKNTRITVKLKMLKMLKGLKAVSQSTSCLD